MTFKSTMVLSLIVRATTLHLQPPGPVIPGHTLNVTWTSSPGDPSQFNLGINCKNIPQSIPIQSSIHTDSQSFSFIVPDKVSSFFPPSVKCFLSATSSNSTRKLLDSVPLTLPGQRPPTAVQATSPDTSTPQTTDTNPEPSSMPGPESNNSSSTSTATSSPPSGFDPNSLESSSTPQKSSDLSTKMKLPAPASASSKSLAQLPSILSTTMATESPMGNSTSTSDTVSKRPTGAIVGGVFGGVFGLVVVAAIVFFFRRKRRNSPDPHLLWTMRDTNMSPSPSLKEEWWAKTAVDETTEQTEKARWDAGTTSHLPNYGYDNTGGWQNRNFSTSTRRNKEEEFELEQERRRKEIYGRMRRVLDNGPGGFDSNVLHN
ncbi:hypothetical protein E4T56_gene11952 [Termitomyces sp. T112]|nr:hypothetical protein E4T56_gene11952 [Termitomyces sp. T112]